MTPDLFSREPLSLAATPSGEAVEIRHILFDAIRTHCQDLGLEEGDVVLCRGETPSHLWLETRAGRTVTLERDWARFVQVEPALSPRTYSDSMPDPHLS